MFLVLAFLYSFSLKRIWYWEFQIVLNNDQKTENSSLISSLSGVGNLILPNIENDLETEVTILESPYILNPIYDFVSLKQSKKNLEYKDGVSSIILGFKISNDDFG